MNLLKDTQLAIANVKIAHLKLELKDYERVLECYVPNVPAFDIIIDKIGEISEGIRQLEKFKNETISE